MPSMPSNIPAHVIPDDYVKVLLVGPVICGKTALWNALKTGSCKPDVFKSPYVDITLDSGEKVCLGLEEAPCQPNYSEIRKMAYEDAKIVLLCFNLTEAASLTSIEETWYPEVRQHNATVPVFLVGMRWAQDGEVTVTAEQAEAVMDKISGVKYFECTCDNVEAVVPVLLKTVAEAVKKVSPDAE